MSRKTKTCAFSKVQQLAGKLTMRTCFRPRHHEGDCMDHRGSWKHDG